jgi:formylglycine-generating enzyme required for sulfatase activity
MDMVGNVWEWTMSPDKPSSFVLMDDQNDDIVQGKRVQRGGAYCVDPQFLRAAFRHVTKPYYKGSTIGFRLAQG